jgi:hypothetical protein
VPELLEHGLLRSFAAACLSSRVLLLVHLSGMCTGAGSVIFLSMLFHTTEQYFPRCHWTPLGAFVAKSSSTSCGRNARVPGLGLYFAGLGQIQIQGLCETGTLAAGQCSRSSPTEMLVDLAPFSPRLRGLAAACQFAALLLEGHGANPSFLRWLLAVVLRYLRASSNVASDPPLPADGRGS